MPRRKPCTECPWRKDVEPGQFPPERYAKLRDTTGTPGNEAPLGAPQFACHKSRDGEEFACAGWLAAVGHLNISARVSAAFGSIPPEALAPPDEDWPELFESYEEMEEVQGDPSLVCTCEGLTEDDRCPTHGELRGTVAERGFGRRMADTPLEEWEVWARKGDEDA